MPRILSLLAGVLIAVLGFADVANATDLTVTCSAPTQNTDGSSLTNLASYRLYGGQAGQTKTKLDEKTTAQGCTFVRPNVALGTHEYYITAVNSVGVESVPSTTVSATVSPPPDQDADGIPDSSDQCPTVKGVAPTGCPLVPNPPSNVAVKADTLAYEMRGSEATGDLRMVSIGYAWEGTPCMQTSVTVKGITYYQIDKHEIETYNALAKLPAVLWARCG